MACVYSRYNARSDWLIAGHNSPVIRAVCEMLQKSKIKVSQKLLQNIHIAFHIFYKKLLHVLNYPTEEPFFHFSLTPEHLIYA